MEQGHNKALILVSALWIAAVSAYMGWGAINHSGLYRWLADLQIAQSGGYYPRWTGILPALLLSAPAIWVLRRAAERGEDEQAAAGPAGEGQRLAKGARNMGISGVVVGIAAIGAFIFAQSLPDGSEPAQPFNLSALGGGGPVPSHKISIRGTVDEEGTTGVTESGQGSERNVMYAGFRPDDAPKDAPLSLFVERNMGGNATVLQGFLPEQEGYLVENGLPALALADLEARGVRIARPHYLLRPPGDGPRTPFYAAAAVGGLLAIFLLIVAVVAALRARGRAMQAA